MVPSAALFVMLTRSAEENKDKKAETYPVFRLGDHPSIVFGKGSHLDFRARFSADKSDSEASTEDPAETSTIDLGKKRIGVSGEIANAVEFQIEAELTNTDPWRDVYGDFKYYDVARVRGGKFKVPFSLDENTGASHLDFMFRSLAATHLAPGRDQGVMVHGRVWKKVIGYDAGVFQHDGKNARTNNPAKVFGGQTTAGRVTFEPTRNMKDALGPFLVGVAFTRSDVPEGISGVRGQTVLDQNFFSSADYLVNGTRRRTGIEMQFLPGPASIKSEWMRLETQRRGESVENTDLSPLVGEGWYVSGTMALTGEKKSRVERPKKPLLQGGFGAVEVGARVESLRFKSGSSSEQGSRSPRADTILGNRDQATTVGVNWYVNRFFKVQANFIREKLDDPSQGPLPSKASFTTKAVRFQFSL
ncbi:MAG TPA: porin [Vicinamibacterales bacterium]|nr:porin [Vicinamibacterales bacterium]